MADGPLTISIEGLPDLERKLGKLKAGEFYRGVMTAAANDIKNVVAKYPGATAGNSPGGPGSRWYERGYGSKWMRKDGSIHGRANSQGLGRRWTTKVDPDGKRAEVGNNATYARYVQDRDKQTSFHKAHGWKTGQDVVDEKGPEVRDKVKAEIDKAWSQG